MHSENKGRQDVAAAQFTEAVGLEHSGKSAGLSLSRRSGFTLVELVVTMLISVILVAITITFLTSGTNFLARAEVSASDKTLASSAADFVKNQLLYASEVKVVYVDEAGTLPDPGDVYGFTVLYIGDEDGASIANTGRLYYKRPDLNVSTNILGDEIYRGKELALEYNAVVTTPGDGSSKAAAFEVVAKVVRDGVQTKEASHIFRMFNVGLNSEPNENASVASWDGEDTANPAKNKKFYLLITPSSEDYATAGIIMDLRGVSNSIDANSGIPYHDLNAAVWKDLSGHGNDVKIFDIYDGEVDVYEKCISMYGFAYMESVGIIPFSSYSQITIEICFAEGEGSGWNGALYGTSTSINSGTIAEVINGQKSFYTIGRMGNASANEESNGRRNFTLSTHPTKFTTHTTVYSSIADPEGRQTFVDGIPIQDSTNNTKTIGSGGFVNRKLLLGANNTNDSLGYFKYAAVRIYGRKLNADEIAKNALTDQLIYNS
jgi:prepilin-type N-terminal cleavage/methylation domain-containing protein